MEKINISKLLKDRPTGYPLDCSMYEDVYFDFVDELNIIHCYIQYETHKTSITFNQHGTPHNDIKSKCVIFPKGKATWEGFQRPFVPGDIVITNNKHAFIYSGENDNYWECYCGVYYSTRNICINSKSWSDKRNSCRLATEKEKEKLFQVIKDNGYRWNAETKTLETLIKTKFKIGDKVRHKNNHCVVFTITNIGEDTYICGSAKAFWFDDQDDYELVPKKFDLNTLKPFDEVLVRNTNNRRWRGQFYMSYDKNEEYPFECAYNCWKQCIPYENNEHLFNKTDDCSDYFKTWE